MTRKDYQTIALAFQRVLATGKTIGLCRAQYDFIIDTFCKALQEDNANFRADLFREACNLP